MVLESKVTVKRGYVWCFLYAMNNHGTKSCFDHGQFYPKSSHDTRYGLLMRVRYGELHCACWWPSTDRYQSYAMTVMIKSWFCMGLALEVLTHWGPVTHICVVYLTIIASDNGLSPSQRQAIIWTNARILLIRPLETNFSEILIEIHTFSFKKMRLNMLSAKRRPFCLGLNVLI